jgi:zinc protease
MAKMGPVSFKSRLVGLVFSIIPVLPAFASRAENPEKYFVLDNGLKIFLYERHNVPLVHIVAAVNAGSKDETDATSGLAHLLEHYILFRGTEVRSGSQVAQDIRRHGGYFNAHTSQDLATFELSLPSESAEFGLRNQKEILFDLKFGAAEVEAEKEIIFEELGQIKDDPFRYASIRLYENLFKGHPYGRPVIGKPEAIRALTIEQIENFYRTRFVPGNCALAVVGDIALQPIEDKVREVFGTVPKADVPPPRVSHPASLSKNIEIQDELDVQEAYLIVGASGPDYNNTDQYASDVLAEILGRGVNPLLYRPLKATRNLVNTASMFYLTLKYGGAFCVYLTLDPNRLAAAKNQLLQFLKQVRNENFERNDVVGEDVDLVFDYLTGAKNQILFAFQKAQESGLTLAESMAMHLLLREGETAPDYLDNIKKVTSSDVRKVAAKYLSRSDYVVVAIVPKKK